jgi:archaemetzincin
LTNRPAAALALGLLLWLACSGPAQGPKAEKGKTPPAKPRANTTREALEPLHHRLGPPLSGDWLAAHPEPGQSYEQYLGSDPTRAAGSRRVLYVCTLGPLSDEQSKVVVAVREYLGLHFGLLVREATAVEALQPPPNCRRKGPLGDEQLLTGWILGELLPPRVPLDAAALLAFTGKDLWPGSGWNFVFGQATWVQRVALFSLRRLGGPWEGKVSYQSTLIRSLKLASHETGHVFGFKHCTLYTCGMNGSNTLEELDWNPLELCPLCLSKLVYATGVDRVERFRKLETFANAHGLEKEALLYQRSAAALEAIELQETPSP